MDGAHAGKPESVEKPYLKFLPRASGSYIVAACAHQPKVTVWTAILVAGAVSVAAATGGGIGSIDSQDLREWLSYIASDELQGRAVYLNRAANDGLPTPLVLNDRFNDPNDLEQVYDRSDHYSYAIYETGLRVANLDHAPGHGNKGPRAGHATQ